MAWVTQGSLASNARWQYNSLEGGLIRRNYTATQSGRLRYYSSSSKLFKSNKNYIFQTTVDSFAKYASSYTYPKYLEIEVPWGATFGYEEKSNIWEDNRPRSTGDTKIFYIDSPTTQLSISVSEPTITYRTTYNNFGPIADSNGTSSINNFKLIETDWFIQGWAIDDSARTDGWWYNIDYDRFEFKQYRYGYIQNLDNSSLSGGSGYLDDEEGTGYIIDNGLGTASISTGSGWGLSVTFSVSGGSVTAVTPISYRGHSYLSSDTISIPGGSTLATIDVLDVYLDAGQAYRKSIGGHTGSNYIARYIDYPSFNITFDVNSISTELNIHLIENLPTTNDITQFNQEIANGQFLGKIDSVGTYVFYNLSGNKYILFNADYQLLGSLVQVSNFFIDGAYQETDNNSQFLFTNSGTYSEPTDLCLIGGSSNATYSVIVANENTLHNPTASEFYGATGSPGFFSNLYGDVINLNQLDSKVGNGIFKAGIWENGVWNSGWRSDSNAYDFDDVEISLLMNTTNTKWRIQIKGPQTSTSNFSVGDKVSIGNIVGIDINEDRKLMKNYFTILSVSNTNIVVEFNNTFPLRRIEKDSENHKIKVTKNVWLNGGFLNGYFEGVWNNGLFKGFPYITEMYNTHWIDGKFDGGHFNVEYPEYRFIETLYYGSTVPNTLGLTFGATAHGFVVGDLIEIDKDDKTLNPQYDGFATVVEVVDEYMVIIDKGFGADSTSEGGIIRRRTGTGVVQYFDFKDNNTATKTLLETNNLNSIYNYNSWIDVKYVDESASNLGRSQIIKDPLTNANISINNLYGHTTNDVLSSVSNFRNSYDTNRSIYSLGVKYKIYEDFLGEISEFNRPFGTAISDGGLSEFISDGWTYSAKDIFSTSTLSLKRDSVTETFEVKLSTSPGYSIFVLNNTNINIEKNRYSMVEYDLLNFQSNTDVINISNGVPKLWLLNSIFKYNSSIAAYPDQEFVIQTRTEETKKYEYFYNRRDLNLSILEGPSSGSTASFDNIKFYELDMIPFFKYTTEDYVNKSVQVPYQGIAPFIDYSDAEFSFIDNINIGLDSLSTQQTFGQPISSDVLSDVFLASQDFVTGPPEGGV